MQSQPKSATNGLGFHQMRFQYAYVTAKDSRYKMLLLVLYEPEPIRILARFGEATGHFFDSTSRSARTRCCSLKAGECLEYEQLARGRCAQIGVKSTRCVYQREVTVFVIE